MPPTFIDKIKMLSEKDYSYKFSSEGSSELTIDAMLVSSSRSTTKICSTLILLIPSFAFCAHCKAVASLEALVSVPFFYQRVSDSSVSAYKLSRCSSPGS